MPWPPRQRAAIAADLSRKGKSREQISAFFHAHGHGKSKMRDHLSKSRRRKRRRY